MLRPNPIWLAILVIGVLTPAAQAAEQSCSSPTVPSLLPQTPPASKKPLGEKSVGTGGLITVDADKSNYDVAGDTAVFTGHVIIRQGQREIKADQVQIDQKKNIKGQGGVDYTDPLVHLLGAGGDYSPTGGADFRDGKFELLQRPARGTAETMNIDALRDAELLKITVPRRFGGHEVMVGTQMAVSEAVGRSGCGSTAWVTALINVCNWMGSLLPEEGQQDIWGQNPDAAIAGVLNPSTDVELVDGGYLVSGRWPWASGSWHADWVLVGIMVPGEEGEFVDQALAFLPVSNITIEETWFVAGMKGTGSNTLVADRVFIPKHRTYSVPQAIQGERASPFVGNEPAYRQSFIPVLTLILGGPQIGLGQAALDYVLEKAGKRGITYTSYEKQADSVGFQLQVAQASMLLDSGRLHMRRAGSDIEAAALAGHHLDYTTRARVRADTSFGIARVREAIDGLLTAHGASAFANVSPLQRIWRDSNAAGRHAVVDTSVNLEVYGKALVGVPYEQNITPLI